MNDILNAEPEISPPPSYDALLLISFGGPEHPDEVMPFLQNVVAGKNVPGERLLEVAQHYDLFDGTSPINAQNRALLSAVLNELNVRGPTLRVYWGNLHWHPMLADTLAQMAQEGVQRALAFATSAYGSPLGCRAYLEAIDRAREAVGPEAPQVDKLRLFFNHPGFIEPMAQRLQAALEQIPASRRAAAAILFAAHSLPVAMAQSCDYQKQIEEACRLVGEQVDRTDWQLVYQSRSGPPAQPWLEPEIGCRLCEMAREGNVADVVIVPIGFVVENMETAYDLDVEITALCDELGMNMVRAGTVGCHPRFVTMIRELAEERMAENPARLALGTLGPSPDRCEPDCCRSKRST